MPNIRLPAPLARVCTRATKSGHFTPTAICAPRNVDEHGFAIVQVFVVAQEDVAWQLLRRSIAAAWLILLASGKRQHVTSSGSSLRSRYWTPPARLSTGGLPVGC